MSNLGWMGRVGLVLSVVWLLGVIAISDENNRVAAIAGLGLVPLAILWGTAWAIQGYLAKRAKRPAEDSRNALRKLWLQLLASVVVIAIASGTAGFMTDGNAAFLAGQWIIPGLIAYAVFRVIPSTAPIAVLAGAMLYSVALVGHAYYQRADEREMLAELTRATPILVRLQDLIAPSESEIEAANLGRFEPFVRVHAHAASELGKELLTYQAAVETAGVAQLLSPAFLATEDGRAVIRQRLHALRQAMETYVRNGKAVHEMTRTQIRAVTRDMSASLAAGLNNGAEQNLKLGIETFDEFGRIQGEIFDEASKLTDFIESLGRRARLVPGEAQNIVFDRDSDLNKYREYLTRINDLATEETKLIERAQEKQRAKARSLLEFVTAP